MDSGEKLCYECLKRSLTRAFRKALKTATGDIRRYHLLGLVYDPCLPATSTALLLLAAHHFRRIAHIHKFSTIKILIPYSKEIKQNMRIAVDLALRLTKDLVQTHNAQYTIEMLDANEEYEATDVPHIKGALRFLALLSLLKRLNFSPLTQEHEQSATLLLLPYTPDIISQWILGSMVEGLTGIATLLNACSSKMCIAAPLTYTSLDYTALIYQFLGTEVPADLSSCTIVDRELLAIQYKSPEYIYGPVKLLRALAHRLSEIG